jgi:hypothetical protein
MLPRCSPKTFSCLVRNLDYNHNELLPTSQNIMNPALSHYHLIWVITRNHRLEL